MRDLEHDGGGFSREGSRDRWGVLKLGLARRCANPTQVELTEFGRNHWPQSIVVGGEPQ